MRLLQALLSTAALFALSVYAQAQSTVVKEGGANLVDAHLSGYHMVRIQGPFDVYIAQGDAEQVQVDPHGADLSRVITEVVNGELNIRLKHDVWGWGEDNWWGNNNNHRHRVEVYISVKNVDAITISGSGSILFKDGVAADLLKLRVNGSGRIEGKATVKTLESHVSGSGRITVSGTAQNSSIGISGSGHVYAKDLVTANSKVHISGSGRAEVNANEALDASVHGSSHVGYTGNASIVNSSKSGSGSISRL